MFRQTQDVHSTGSSFPWETLIIKIAIPRYVGITLAQLQKFQKLHMCSLTTPRGSKLRLFSLNGQRHRNKRLFCSICHIWAWNFVRLKLYIWSLSTPIVRNWAYCRALWAEVSQIELCLTLIGLINRVNVDHRWKILGAKHLWGTTPPSLISLRLTGLERDVMLPER